MVQRRRTVNVQKGDAILKAAVNLFLTYGFEKTTMDAIATTAGVTKQTVYSHYKNKEALFVRMITDLCRQGVSQAPLKTQNQTVEEVLTQVGTTLLTTITSPGGMAVTRLVVAEAARHPAIARMYYENGTRRIITLLAQVLDAQNARGLLAIPNTESAGAYFFALLKGQYFLRMTLNITPLPSPREKKSHVKETVAIFMRLYGGKKPMHTTSTV